MDEKQFKGMLKIIKQDDADAFKEFVEAEDIQVEEIETADSGIVYLLAEHGAYNILYFVLTNYELEVNDEDGFCSALNVTEDSRIRNLLFEHGANNTMEDYDGMRFAVDTINWEVISLNSDFREELIDAVIKKHGVEDADNFDFYKEALCFDIKDGEVIIEEKELDELYGIDLYEVAKEFQKDLSYGLDFEGSRWKFETNGVYFVS